MYFFFFSSDFSLIHVFTPFWVLSGTVSRLHAKSASLRWSICRSVLFKLMMTLICCVWSSVIGERSSIFLKVDVFCFPLCSCQEISCECMYFQDNLIFEDWMFWGCLWGGVVSFTLPLCFNLSCNWFVHHASRTPASCHSVCWISTAIKAKVDLYRAHYMLKHPLVNMEVHKSLQLKWLTIQQLL